MPGGRRLPILLKSLLAFSCAVVFVTIHVTLRLQTPLARPSELVLRIGLIADVQYVDADDSYGLTTGRRRYHRRGAESLRDAVNHWRAERVDGVFQLGDLIDGKSGQLKRAKEDLALISNIISTLPVRWYHSVGNHDRYIFGEKELREWIRRDGSFHLASNNYFAFIPAPGFMVVMLHSYEISSAIKKDRSPEDDDYDHDRVKAARRQLNDRNPNENKNSPLGLTGLDRRWVASNGALGVNQLQWFNRTLRKARMNGNKVIVVSHIPIHPQAVADYANLAWDYDSALQIIRGAGKGVVVAAFAGHDHRGGLLHSVEEGVLYLTLSSVLEAEMFSRAFAVGDFYQDRLHLRGFGDVPSLIVKFHDEVAVGP